MRQILTKWIRYFFGISRTEANGVIVLVIILIIAAVIPMSLGRLYKNRIADEDQLQKLDSLVTLFEENQISVEETAELDTSEILNVIYFEFDPNTASFNDFISLGLSSELGNRIIKYRENGGMFHKREDLKKIYGLSEDEYNNLLPYISIKEMEIDFKDSSEPEKESRITREAEIPHFDINKVDSSELVIINGIGEVLAGRIVKFRTSLGGYIRMDQLHEVYGLEEYAYENLKLQSYVDSIFVPKKILINKWPADSIARHPYIDYNKAKVITAYRQQHGDFENLDDMRKIRVLDESWLNRISPYLEF